MMRLLQKRFQLQLLFALIAACSVGALTIGLVIDSVRHAEGFVVADANRALARALQELDAEYRARTKTDAYWADLPSAARDLSLRAISSTVLGAYPGVEGGFWIGSQFAGYSFPTHDGGSPKIDVPAAEESTIARVIRDAARNGRSSRTLRGRSDILSISAMADGDTVVWVMKRLPGIVEPGRARSLLLLTALIACALLGVAGVLATGIGLHRGVAQIKRALGAVDKDFAPALPARRDELGEIGAAITEMAAARRKLEQELRREDRARTMGRLTGRIAHELRNPLNSIRLSLRMLQHRHEENRLRADDFRIVVDEIDRMNCMLSDLLAFQQPRPPVLRDQEIGPILDRCAELIRPQAAKRGVDVSIKGDGARRTLADEHFLRQIVINLLLNAVEVSPPGGMIRVAAAAENGRVTVAVSDDGPGLTAEQREHLFEPFYTTRPDGHGLGLAVSREIAQAMGATLEYCDRARTGATFVLTLRAAEG